LSIDPEPYQRVAAKAEAAAKRFAGYPVLLAELLDLIQLAAQVDREASAVNIRAAPGEHRRVRAVELLARGLKAFSISHAAGLLTPPPAWAEPTAASRSGVN
jgi:hypothetical protein